MVNPSWLLQYNSCYDPTPIDQPKRPTQHGGLGRSAPGTADMIFPKSSSSIFISQSPPKNMAIMVSEYLSEFESPITCFHVDHVVLDQLTCTRAMGSFSGRVGTKRETSRDTNGFFWRRGLNILGKQTSKRKRNIKEPHVKFLFFLWYYSFDRRL